MVGCTSSSAENTTGTGAGDAGNTDELAACQEGSLAHLLTHRTQVDPGLGYALPEGVGSIEISVPSGAPAIAESANTAVYLRDGSAVYFNKEAAVRGEESEAAKALGDGLPAGMIVLYDYNGKKLPNALSTCAEDGTSTDLDLAASSCAAKKAFIKDIFTIGLRGSLAVPAGAAANWAAGNKDAAAYGDFSASSGTEAEGSTDTTP